MQMKAILEDANRKQRVEEEEVTKAAELQQQLVSVEGDFQKRLQASTKKQQEFELALIQATNKLEELKVTSHS